MLFEFSNILVSLILAVFFVLFLLVFSKILRPHKKSDLKISTYECGEEPIGQAWARFNFRYYVLALLFVIFDVEVAFLYPCAVVYRKWIDQGLGMLVFCEILFFMVILFMALIYAWKKGDLEWFKKITGGKFERDTLR